MGIDMDMDMNMNMDGHEKAAENETPQCECTMNRNSA
jgi:hypothetical protein